MGNGELPYLTFLDFRFSISLSIWTVLLSFCLQICLRSAKGAIGTPKTCLPLAVSIRKEKTSEVAEHNILKAKPIDPFQCTSAVLCIHDPTFWTMPRYFMVKIPSLLDGFPHPPVSAQRPRTCLVLDGELLRNLPLGVWCPDKRDQWPKTRLHFCPNCIKL